ncbi:cytochrome c : Cytochrome C OS=Singulisphaera acidiphila (strain ATCC BAA-1392 / DSM 18658 / VKM B-2454 / MOB10) GN=Sinac_3849 PE=4 SV=1: Cytochrom_C_2 [Gemmataceae bacterium]|nr:cytochrome c : Cytochrome C OS=Singulisphaera acidiphila (strain ATCC BAA-1392 / DSM 18658 / VKM B-2454 / MOB10) GN=Sinac_3849 PE=4 SV=1: Cytochrom_C_2 [Gemmataceae bacterium]VTU01823.1 cytochrome c : Cytochrome C OS=Singulisphaera acidiphila (strain ATCC BAA-1392 / DSM 18658 / VKM B-2454 / MOB10) GN=Sinac_3849 PE=4 SV=1: Cytochrom_C_2 [Gemmataceae bacterium]
MLRKLTSVVAGLGMAALVLAFGGFDLTAAADDKKKDETPTIKEIMAKGHKGTDAYMGKVKAAVKGEKWDDAQKYAKAMLVFGEALGKNKPKKGDADSWKTLSEKYAADTKSLFDATEKKDAKAANEALGVIGGSCGGCHKVHK